MAKLYELTEQYNNLVELIENPDVPQELLEESLNQINEELEVKLENIAKLIRQNELSIKNYKDEEKRLSDRRKTLENKNKYLKDYTENCMKSTGVTKIKGKVFTLNIQRNAPSIKIDTLEYIPEEHFVSKKELNKISLKNALKNGEEIEGVSLIQTESLRIR